MKNKLFMTLGLLTILATGFGAQKADAAESHTVQSGDTLYRIAINNNMSVETLMSINGKGSNTIIHPGEVLKLNSSNSSNNDQYSAEKTITYNQEASTNTSGPLSVGYTVTSTFGSRWGEHHDGIDLAAPTGSVVNSVKGGTVVNAEYHHSAGNHVIVLQDDGYYAYYMHLSGFGTSVGQRVEDGSTIGYVGSTGNSTGPHLHFGLSTSIWSGFQDPSGYLGIY